jgi:hypothetical protein
VRCATHVILLAGVLAARQILNTHTQDHAIFGFTPFEIAPTYLHRKPSVHSLGKEVIRKGEGEKLKGDGRSIGQEEKRGAPAWCGLMLAFFLRPLAEHTEPSSSVAAVTSLGT